MSLSEYETEDLERELARRKMPNRRSDPCLDKLIQIVDFGVKQCMVGRVSKTFERDVFEEVIHCLYYGEAAELLDRFDCAIRVEYKRGD